MVDPDPAALKKLGKCNINNKYSIYVFLFHVILCPFLNGQLRAHRTPAKHSSGCCSFTATELKQRRFCLRWYFFLREVEGTPSPFICGLLKFLVFSAGIVLVVKLVYNYTINTVQLFLAFFSSSQPFLIKFYLIASLI